MLIKRLVTTWNCIYDNTSNNHLKMTNHIYWKILRWWWDEIQIKFVFLFRIYIKIWVDVFHLDNICVGFKFRVLGSSNKWKFVLGSKVGNYCTNIKLNISRVLAVKGWMRAALLRAWIHFHFKRHSFNYYLFFF